MRIGHQVARALAGLTLLSASAQAQVVVTNTVKYEAAWFTNVLPVSFGVSLPKLNTNYSYFGTILSIEVGMFTTNSLDAAMENDSQSAALFTLVASGSVRMTNPGPYVLEFNYFDVELAQTNLAATTPPTGGGPDYAFLDDQTVTGSASGLVSSAYYSGSSAESVGEIGAIFPSTAPCRCARLGGGRLRKKWLALGDPVRFGIRL